MHSSLVPGWESRAQPRELLSCPCQLHSSTEPRSAQIVEEGAADGPSEEVFRLLRALEPVRLKLPLKNAATRGWGRRWSTEGPPPPSEGSPRLPRLPFPGEEERGRREALGAQAGGCAGPSTISELLPRGPGATRVLSSRLSPSLTPHPPRLTRPHTSHLPLPTTFRPKGAPVCADPSSGGQVGEQSLANPS